MEKCIAKLGYPQIETLSTSLQKTAKEIDRFGHVLLSGSLGKLSSEQVCGSATGIARSPSCPPIRSKTSPADHQLVPPKVSVD